MLKDWVSPALGKGHRGGRKEVDGFEIQLAMWCWMQNVNRCCMGACLIGNGCACLHLAAWEAVAVLGSFCPCIGHSCLIVMWHLELKLHLRLWCCPSVFAFAFYFSSFRSLQAALLLFFSDRGVGAASSVVQTCLLTVEVELRSRVALASALFWWQCWQFRAMQGHHLRVCLYGFQEYVCGRTSCTHSFKYQVSLIISWHLCALPAFKAKLWNCEPFSSPWVDLTTYPIYLFWYFMESVIVKCSGS